MKTSSDALLRGAVDSGDVPGVVAAVTTRDNTIYEAAYGVRVQGQAAVMSQDTVMWIASMTKPVVGAAAMQLVEQGRIGLDDPAAKIIPELGNFRVLDGWEANGQPRTRPPKTAITLRNLLTHTAGFTYDIWNADMARYLKTMNLPRAGSGRNIALRIPLSFDPGGAGAAEAARAGVELVGGPAHHHTPGGATGRPRRARSRPSAWPSSTAPQTPSCCLRGARGSR